MSNSSKESAQSLYGKLQLLNALTYTFGGKDAAGIMVHKKKDYGFLLALVQTGHASAPIWVYDKTTKWHPWIRQSFDQEYYFETKGQAPLGVVVKEEMVASGSATLLVFDHLEIIQDYYFPDTSVRHWFTGDLGDAGYGVAEGMNITGNVFTGWSIANFPFLSDITGSASLEVGLKANAIVNSQPFEYDIEDGGFGDNIIIIGGGGGTGGGIQGQDLTVYRNTYFKVKLTSADGITGYSALPPRVRFNTNTQILEGYFLDPGPTAIEFDLANGEKFLLLLRSYKVERSAM